ncbi:MAG: hypothetical protein ACR2II_00545 [Chthoniobacterales bacterium]
MRKLFSRRLFSWICTFVVFALACAELGWLFPRQVSGISLKVRHFTERKKKVDILFVGSSRIYHGISPQVFDQTLRAPGRRWHSFNMGMDGMTTAESFALVRRLLALHVHKPKYIFFEVQSGIGAGTPIKDDEVKERDVYWRDWDSLLAGFRKLSAGLSWSGGTLAGQPYSLQRWNYFGPLFMADLRLWIRNAINFGLGDKVIARYKTLLPVWGKAAAPKPSPIEGSDLPSSWDGYFAMSQPMAGETLAGYRADLEKALSHPIDRAPDLIMRAELQHFEKAMARRKIQIVFVVPPALLGSRGSELNAPLQATLFNYNDLVRYPQFFAEENRLDSAHLNGPGANLFSATLARDFARTLPPVAR